VFATGDTDAVGVALIERKHVTGSDADAVRERAFIELKGINLGRHGDPEQETALR
jgi:hypothetical protein